MPLISQSPSMARDGIIWLPFCAAKTLRWLRRDGTSKLGGNFGSTTVEIPEGNWNQLLTGESFEGSSLRAQNILKRFPVALLVRNGE